MPERDRQRARVYAWEEQFIALRDQTSITFAQAQGMIDAIWADLGFGAQRCIRKSQHRSCPAIRV